MREAGRQMQEHEHQPNTLRLTRTEANVAHLQSDITYVKGSLQRLETKVDSNFKWLLGVFGAGFVILGSATLSLKTDVAALTANSAAVSIDIRALIANSAKLSTDVSALTADVKTLTANQAA